MLLYRNTKEEFTKVAFVEGEDIIILKDISRGERLWYPAGDGYLQLDSIVNEDVSKGSTILPQVHVFDYQEE